MYCALLITVVFLALIKARGLSINLFFHSLCLSCLAVVVLHFVNNRTSVQFPRCLNSTSSPFVQLPQMSANVSGLQITGPCLGNQHFCSCVPPGKLVWQSFIHFSYCHRFRAPKTRRRERKSTLKWIIIFLLSDSLWVTRTAYPWSSTPLLAWCWAYFGLSFSSML